MKFLLALALLISSAVAQDPTASFPVRMGVDATRVLGEVRPIWRYFGYDEANYTYMQDGQKLLAELAKLGSSQVYVRCHHLLTSGDGTPGLKWSSTGLYREDAAGNPLYDWTIVDRIFDTYRERGLQPYVQLGFMPEALTTHPEDYPHGPVKDGITSSAAGQAWPPKDYVKWGELAYQWARHCAERYGRAEAESWPWEIWNEPNIHYWHGTPEEFFKLYDYGAAGILRALPKARIGGPETGGGAGHGFLAQFLEHCARGANEATGSVGAPLHFISFHAKGKPKFLEGHARMGMGPQLQDLQDAYAVVASFPEYRALPMVIGECDPEGCAACRSPQTGYRNGTLYASYTAASFPRAQELAEGLGLNLEGALSWSFEFEDQPFFAGFRALATNGLDLPVLNVFRMFAQMKGQRLAVQSDHASSAARIIAEGVRDSPDVAAVSSLEGQRLCVMAWHYHHDDLPGPTAEVDLQLDHLPMADGPARLRTFLIDESHSNSFTAWQRMGSPAMPTPAQYAELEHAGQLAEIPPAEKVIQDAGATVHLSLPRQAVALLILEPR